MTVVNIYLHYECQIGDILIRKTLYIFYVLMYIYLYYSFWFVIGYWAASMDMRWKNLLETDNDTK